MSISRKLQRARERALRSPKVQELLRSQQKAFEKKFGRPMTDEDPLFFDPDFTEPRHWDPDKIREEMIQSMKQAGTPPRLIYAFEKTGLIMTTDNQHLMSPKDISDWNKAMEEYFAAHPEGE